MPTLSLRENVRVFAEEKSGTATLISIEIQCKKLAYHKLELIMLKKQVT